MQALVTLPPGLTTLPQTFRKINKTVYYEQRSKKFYKITVAEPLTMFIGQNLVTRQNLIVTKYDPAYLALHILADENVINVQYIPSYLNQAIFQQFTQRQGGRMRANQDKILAFLEKRIDRLNELIQTNQYMKLTKKLDFVSKDKDADHRKPIKSEIIQILRREVPEVYLSEILRTIYHEQHKVMKPVVTDNYFEEIQKQQNKDKMKNKKKPPSKANIIQPLPKNQPTLFHFGSKKQPKPN